MSDKNTGKTVHFSYDPANPPEMTAEESRRLEGMRDEDIDLSDIPEQSGKPFWRPGEYGAGTPGQIRTALQAQLLPIDKDVLLFFKDHSESPVEEVNSVLREYVATQRQRKRA